MLYNNIYAFENAIPAYAAAFMKKCSDLKLNIMNKRKYVEDGITKYTFTVNNPYGTGAGSYDITVENEVESDHNITCTCPAFKYSQHGTCKHIGNLIYYICHVYDTDVFERSRLSESGLNQFTKFYDFVLNYASEIYKLCKEIDPSLPYHQPVYSGPNAPMTPPRVERVRECPPAPTKLNMVSYTPEPSEGDIVINMDNVVIKAFHNILTHRPELRTFIKESLEKSMDNIITNMLTLNVSH